MKRYLCLTVAMMLLATSCKMNDGEQRELIDIGNCIAYATISHYNDALQSLDNAIICDMYLSCEDETKREEIISKLLRDFTISYEENVIRVKWNDDYDYEVITTDGNLLSEGGTWTISKFENKGATITPNDNGGYDYTLISDNRKMEFVVSDIDLGDKNKIEYTLSGYLNIVDHSGCPEDKPLLLDTTISEPIDYVYKERYNRSRYKKGVVDIVCNDQYYGTVDEVKLSFIDSDRARVDYRGQVSNIQQ